MLAIFKREFRSLFQNVIGFLFLGVNLAIFGLYFFIYCIMYGEANIAYPLSGTTFIFLITVPILTMRVIAEDRKNKTDQLILTAPVSVFKIVFGKFLSLAATFTIVCGVYCIAPLFLAHFGTISIAQCYVAILGYWFYGITCIAIGVFASSLFENQLIAAVVTFVLLFLGYMMSAITGNIGDSESLINKILSCYDLTTPLDEMLNGSLSFLSMIYFASISALCLFLTCQVIEKRRWTISTKKIFTSAFSVAAIAVACAATILINFGFSKLPEDYQSIDCTEKKLYSITQDTIDYLKNVNSDVTIYVTAAKSDADSNLKKTLKQYTENCDSITVKYIDTEKNPDFASKYTSSDLSSGSLIVVADNRYTTIDANDLYEYQLDYSSYSYTATGYDAEGQITSALQYVLSDSLDVLYQITGHGETELSGNFSSALSKANFEVSDLNLMDVDSIDQTASAIIINGPTSDFSDDDTAKILDYIANGGNCILTTDYSTINDLTNVKKVMSTYGVSVANGIVVEGDSSYYYQKAYYLLPNIESADVTSDLDSYVFMPYSSGLSFNTEDEDTTYTITNLLETSDQATAMTYDDTGMIDTENENGGNTNGPFSVGLGISTADSDTSNFYIFASDKMLDDSADSIVSGTNSQLFANIVSTFKSDSSDTASVVIPVKEYEDSTITFSESATLWYGLAWGIFVPIALIILGIVIFIRRRVKH